MSKTPVGKDYLDTVSLIDESITPAIEKIIHAANKILAQRNLQVGLKLEWLIEYANDESSNGKKD